MVAPSWVTVAGSPSGRYVVSLPSSEVASRPSSSKVCVAAVDPVVRVVSCPVASTWSLMVSVVVVGLAPVVRVVRVVWVTFPETSS